MTVEEYLTQWFSSTMSTRADKTNDTYESILRCHVIPNLGQFPLGKLQPLQVQEMYEKLGARLAPRSVHDVHRVLSRALKQAVIWRYLERNVCTAVVPPTVKRPLIVTLTRDETLRWQDVDLDAAMDAAMVRIQQTAQWIDGKGWILKGPKTDASRRSVLLTADMVDVLKRHRTKQLADRLKLGDAYEDMDLVFASSVGTPVNPATLRRVWAGILEKAGLSTVGGRPFRFHDLRHSHATQLLEQRVPTKVVSERLGHSTTAITREFYQHVTATMQEEAVRDYGGWLSGENRGRATGAARPRQLTPTGEKRRRAPVARRRHITPEGASLRHITPK